MDWTINLMLGVILTSITGSVMFIFWYGLGWLMERLGFLNYVYEMLKAVLFFWYVPVVYLALVYGNDRYIYWGGFVFKGTPTLQLIGKIFCAIWIPSVCVLIIKYVLQVYGERSMYKYSVFCDGWEYDYFEQICEEMNIKVGKVELVQDIHAKVPKIIGAFKPMIVLPVKEYTEYELRVIFIHELTHYKQKDLWLIYLTEFAKCFQICNPLIWKFFKTVQYWGEPACDYDSVKRLDELKPYFDVIAMMAVDEEDRGFLVARLVEKKNDLVDRMNLMKRSYRMKNKSKFKAGLVMASLIILSTCSVSAATLSSGEAYTKAYYATVEDVNEPVGRSMTMSNDESIEYEIPAGEFDAVEDIGEVDVRTRGSMNFGWTIGGLASKKSTDFSTSAGKTISVSATTDPSISFRAGIIEPDGTRRYVDSINGVAAHVFDLDQTGKYSVFIQNMTTGTIDVGGSYYY